MQPFDRFTASTDVNSVSYRVGYLTKANSYLSPYSVVLHFWATLGGDFPEGLPGCLLSQVRQIFPGWGNHRKRVRDGPECHAFSHAEILPIELTGDRQPGGADSQA